RGRCPARTLVWYGRPVGVTAPHGADSAIVRTVLIFAYECAPHQSPRTLVAGQRPAQLAKYLPAHGWRSIVICCDSRRRGAVARVEESVVDDLVDQCLSTLATAPAAIVATPSLRHDGWLDRGWHLSERSARRFRPLVPVRKMLTAAKLFTGDYSQAWQPMA